MKTSRLTLMPCTEMKALGPLSREVLIARDPVGESCVEIGRRYGRTEQTVSGCCTKRFGK